MIRTLRELMRARWSWGAVLLLLAIQAWVEMRGGYLAVADLYERWGLSPDAWRQGHYVSLITYAFLHDSFTHVICNGLMLLFLGARLESWLGGKRLLWLWLGGILAGGCIHLWMSGSSEAVLVGASGAAMALLLCFTTLSPQSRFFLLPLSAGNVGLGVLISSLILMLLDPHAPIALFAGWGKAITARLGDDMFRIGHACHFGGALFGYLFAKWMLRRPVTLEELRENRRRRENAEQGT